MPDMVLTVIAIFTVLGLVNIGLDIYEHWR